MITDYKEFEEKLSSHPSEEMLADFYHGRLDDIEHVTVQCHLIDCDECASISKDVIDFIDAADNSDIALSKKEIEQVWTNVREKVKSNGVAAIFPSGNRPKFVPARWALFATAAIVSVSLLSLGAWIIKLRNDNEKLARQATALTGQLEEMQKDLSSRIEELEKEPAQQKQAQETVRDEKPHDALSAPLSLNVPVHNIYSTQWVKRSGEENAVNRIKLLPRDKSVVLILVGESQQGSPKYGIEIIDPKGRTVQQNQELLKNSYGNFVISLSREFLRPGTYRIRTRGQGGGPAEQITEYLVKVE